MNKQERWHHCESLVNPASRFLCDDFFWGLWKTYYEAVEVIQKTCFIQRDYDMQPVGSGFDQMPTLLYTQPGTDPDREQYVEVKRVRDFQRVFCTHAHSTVLPTNNAIPIEKQNRPLLFYLEQSEADPSCCRIRVTRETLRRMTETDYGLSEEDTCIAPDNPKARFLSSVAFARKAETAREIFLNVSRPLVGELNPQNYEPLGTEDGATVTRNKRQDAALLEAHGMAGIMALECPTWSHTMVDDYRFTSGTSWPDDDTKMDVFRAGYHLVPHEAFRGRRYSGNQGPVAPMTFRLDFSKAECCIFKKLNFIQRQIVYCVQSLLWRVTKLQSHDTLRRVVKYCILQSFQEDYVWSQTHVLRQTQDILLRILKCLETQECRHYFLPDCNILADIPAAECTALAKDIYDIPRHIVTLMLQSQFLPIQGYLTIQGIEFETADGAAFDDWLTNEYALTLRPLLSKALLQAFDDVISLLITWCFCRLHDESSLDRSIEMHEEFAQLLKTRANDRFRTEHHMLSTMRGLTKFFLMFLQINIGTLHHAKAVLAESDTEKAEQFALAHKLLKNNVDCDMIFGRLRLAHMLYSKSALGQMKGVLDPVFEDLEALHYSREVQVEDFVFLPDVTLDVFRVELWSLWLRGLYSYEIHFTKVLRPIFLTQMRATFDLTRCYAFGLRLQPVALFSPRFFAEYLLVLYYMECKEYSQADHVLTMAEHACAEEPQPDLNERRIAAYFNIIMQCYKDMKNHGRAAYMRHKSLTLLPGPRNPASTSLLGEYLWELAKKGAKIVAYSALAYVVGHCVHRQLRSSSS